MIEKNTEEKIEYIYQTLKKQESQQTRATLFKWGFRIFILLYLVYFIKVGLPLMIDSFLPQLPSLQNGQSMNQILESVQSGTSSGSQKLKDSLSDYFSN